MSACPFVHLLVYWLALIFNAFLKERLLQTPLKEAVIRALLKIPNCRPKRAE